MMAPYDDDPEYGNYMLSLRHTEVSATRYGDIMKVDTKGATSIDAHNGVRASNDMAKEDQGSMLKYKAKILRVGLKKSVDPAVIAAIISRESRAGDAPNFKTNGGWGDWSARRQAFNAFGLMQVDVVPVAEGGGGHIARGVPDWACEEHLEQATDIFIWMIERIQTKCPGWTKEKQLKGGLVAYNKGESIVNKDNYRTMDEGTHGKDYANDVVARAQWYKRNGY